MLFLLKISNIYKNDNCKIFSLTKNVCRKINLKSFKDFFLFCMYSSQFYKFHQFAKHVLPAKSPIDSNVFQKDKNWCSKQT